MSQKDVKSNNVLPVQSIIAKASGPVLPHQLPQALSASAPRRDAGSAGLPISNGSQKFLVVPSASGRPVLQRLESKAGMDLDTDTASISTAADASPPPSPSGGSDGKSESGNQPARDAPDGVRTVAKYDEDPIGTFTLLRAEFDNSRGRRQERPYMRISRVSFSTNDNWTTGGANVASANIQTSGKQFRLPQATAGNVPGPLERVGQMIDIHKLIIRYKFWGITYTNWAGASPQQYQAILWTPKHRVVIARDKWPQLGAPIWQESLPSTGSQETVNINALMANTYGDAAGASNIQLQRVNSTAHQSPLTKDVRFEILHDEIWVPGTNEANPAQISVTGNYLYRSWQEDLKITVHPGKVLYKGPLSGDIFTNDIIAFVMRDISINENGGANQTTVTSNYDLQLYAEWQDMQTTPGGGLPGPTAAAAAAK